MINLFRYWRASILDPGKHLTRLWLSIPSLIASKMMGGWWMDYGWMVGGLWMDCGRMVSGWTVGGWWMKGRWMDGNGERDNNNSSSESILPF